MYKKTLFSTRYILHPTPMLHILHLSHCFALCDTFIIFDDKAS